MNYIWFWLARDIAKLISFLGTIGLIALGVFVVSAWLTMRAKWNKPN